MFVLTGFDKIGYGYALSASALTGCDAQRVQFGKLWLRFYGKCALFWQFSVELSKLFHRWIHSLRLPYIKNYIKLTFNVITLARP